MEFRGIFKHMAASAALEDQARAKLGDVVGKFAPRSIEARATFSVEAGQHRVSCLVTGAEGRTVTADDADPANIYAALDRAVDKVAAKLRRQKEKRRSHRLGALIDLSAPAGLSLPPMDEEPIDAADIVAAVRAKANPTNSSSV